MLIKYLRDENRNPVGVIVATGKYKVGWSKKHPRDRWDRETAWEIAQERAESDFDWGLSAFSGIDHLPVKDSYRILMELRKMRNRSARYFKD